MIYMHMKVQVIITLLPGETSFREETLTGVNNAYSHTDFSSRETSIHTHLLPEDRIPCMFGYDVTLDCQSYRLCTLTTFNTEYPSCVREFSDKEILESTRDLDALIGKGGFGRVYKGNYHGTDVAIKVLSMVS